MKFVNLTSESISVKMGDDVVMKLPAASASDLARVTWKLSEQEILPIEECVVRFRRFENHVVGLPPEKPGTLYVVPADVLSEMNTVRHDLLAVDKNVVDEDEDGFVYRGFVR